MMRSRVKDDKPSTQTTKWHPQGGWLRVYSTAQIIERFCERGGMVDAAGLNPAAEVRAGSSPAARTNGADDAKI